MKKFFKKFIPLRIKYLIASLHRRRLSHVTFIGITGSAGKTTTKDLAATILANFDHCQQTLGSRNTPVGVAHTIFGRHANTIATTVLSFTKPPHFVVSVFIDIQK